MTIYDLSHDWNVCSFCMSIVHGFTRRTSEATFVEGKHNTEGRIYTCRCLQFFKKWPDWTSAYYFLSRWVKFQRILSMQLVWITRTTRKLYVWENYSRFQGSWWSYRYGYSRWGIILLSFLFHISLQPFSLLC